jgi:hypothetical protein
MSIGTRIAGPDASAPFLEYLPHATPRPFVDALFAAGGVRVTRDLMAGVPADSDDHPHQKGLWWGHRDVGGADIWTEFEGHGSIRPAAPPEISATRAAVWRLRHRMQWLDAGGTPLIDDLRVLRVHPPASDGSRALDVETTMTPSGERIVLGDTKEAGLVAIRLAPALEERRGGRIELATGAVGEAESWGRAAPWCDYSGQVDGSRVGVAILDAPGNPRPAYWHVRDYGLMTANPFGLGDFPGGGDGSLGLEPGEATTFRYRVLVHHGDARDGRVAEHYARYVDGIG